MSTKTFDAVIIGAGTGGYPCAIRLAQLGKKVAIIEKEKLGGVCLNVGCIPSKALIHGATVFYNMKHEAPEMGIGTGSLSCDLKKMKEWKDGVVAKLTGGVGGLLKANGVETILGTAVVKDGRTVEVTSQSGVQTLQAGAIVLATGSRIIEIPTLPTNGRNIVNSTEALDLTKLPKKLIVIGGGFIGLEIGTAYAKLGSEVTIIEAGEQLVPSIEKEIVMVVEKKLKKLGVITVYKSRAVGLKEKDPAKSDVLHLDVDTPEGRKTFDADCILVAVGRKPNSDNMGLEKLGIKMDPRGNIITNNQSLTNVPNVYAVGDVTGAPQLAHRASMDGLLAAGAIAGQKSFKDYKTIPWAVFSDPEIATVGLTETEAKEKGIKYRVGKFPFAASGRALALNDSDGFIKVLLKEDDDTLIGCHIVGPEASNLIAEAALAIEMGACGEDIMRTIHTHPTLPEVFPEAVEAAHYESIHIFKPKPGAKKA